MKPWKTATLKWKASHAPPLLSHCLTSESEIGYRANAIFLQGAPISHLPTARLFAYAKHFDTTPLGLEWVNDQTCILVYKSNFLARAAFGALQKSSIEDPDPDGFVTAKPIPISLWPAEARINKTLGKSEGLKGVLRMRWAKPGDVKKRGAKKESEFYKRHGVEAGKESFNGRDLPPAKRARKDDVDWTAVNEDTERQRLDAELDQLRQASDIDEAQSIDELDEAPASPPSKMRSDYIAKDGKTLIDRFSDSNLFDFNPKKTHRLQGERGIWKFADDREEELGSGSLRQRLSLSKVDSDSSRRSGGLGGHNRDTRNSRTARRKGGRSSRQKMTQQELDDELDALKQES